MTYTLYTPPEQDQKPWQYFYQSMQNGFDNGWINHDPANNFNTASPLFKIVPKGHILMIVQGVNTLLGSTSNARHAHRKFLMIYENPAKNIGPTPVFANYDDERQIFTDNFVMTIHTERNEIRQAFSELVESFSQPSIYKLNKALNLATPRLRTHSLR